MADKSEYYEFLYAYTLGCLDEDDLVNLKQYLNSNDDYYWQELGDFQNLSALLPSILAIEKPDSEVKDRVARKLYRIRNEIKAKRDKLKSERQTPKVTNEEEEVKPEITTEPVEEIEESVVEEEQEQQEILDEEPKKDIDGFEVVTSQHKPAEIVAETDEEKVDTKKEQTKEEEVLNFNVSSEATTDDEIDTTSEEPVGPSLKSREDIESKIPSGERRKARYKRVERLEEKEKKKSSAPFIITSLLMFILAIVFVFLYFKVSSNVKGYESQIISLNKQIGSLKEQFVRNKDLQSVLGSKNLKTVSLTGSDIAPNAFGKLFISLDTNHGIIQLSNLPQLHGKGTYQLWIYIYDNYMSLGKFSPLENTAYFPFDTPQLDQDSSVSFLVTEEPPNGSLQPGNKVYLKGSF